ncbi:alpha/beta hydrolase [Gilvibacter sediminis]|uniref:alpha/beta hydrolase n=1 Tax=Gilvibacter sediminis TaxID=379071 RepID=UPI00234FF63A|nr:alpha/beta hydrolase [Gilvibacter sediminis]MDC7997915.1 alpha/beta hydrolase [Gilvibacter sediminis]
MKNYIPFILTLLLLWACSSDEQTNNPTTDDEVAAEVPLEASVALEVPYGADPLQRYDLYLPAGRTAQTTKVIVLVHGGGWVSGDKADMTPFIDLIQEELPQYAIVNLNYKLADLENPAFPNQFLDVKAALAQIKAQANELQIVPEFALIGTSAGAHLSLMMDYVYDDEDWVKMVCSIVGPTDFTDPFYSENPEYQILFDFLVDESAYAADTDYAVATSPVFQVNANSAPTIMFYGNEDPLVPISNGTNLEAALADASISHSFTIYDGGHGDDWSPENYENLQQQLIAYIQEHLPVNP